ISPERVVITPGASGALLLVFALLCNPGESVLMTDPGYPCNRQFLRLMEAEAQAVPVDASNGYQITEQLLDQHWQPNSRGVLLASPSNPTGSLASRAQLQSVSDAVEKRNGFLIVDEIYDSLVYDQNPVSILEVNDQAYVINSFSKYFGMTGWRVGWVIAPENAVPELEKLIQNIFIAAPTLAQQAAVAAFQPECIELLESRKTELKARRDYLLPELQALGFRVDAPSDGAFFIYANIEKFSHDSETFCLKLLEQQGIAITPGIDFGTHHANTHVRIAYTQPIDRLELAIERLRLALA
ncbi:MAG: aminotransferase class I/II-fold pyridoxal phosphate-dependent enzyme, partial [Pseudomonadales bacterium]|nr:aminotransferase class I/II-fold pyridoxal phosphate-dependent enzyme [Pseudomonadales bacterium]